MEPPLASLELDAYEAPLPDSSMKHRAGIVRIGVLNTKMLPFSSAGRRAEVMAERILAGDFAAVALSEVFSETGRNRLVELLGESYPHRIEFLGSDELHRLDSGLMLLSRYPLLAIPDTVPDRTHRVRGSVVSGTEPDFAAGFVRFAEFGDCARFDCWAAKGVGYVRLDLEAGPLHLFFTHMQASYGSDDERGERQTAAVRAKQRKEMAAFVTRVAGAELERGESALLVGDLNVDGSADLTGGIGKRTALIGDEREAMLAQLGRAFPHGLSDTWREHAPSDDPGLTFPVRSLNVRFDYVLASLPPAEPGLCVGQIRRAFGLDMRRAPTAALIDAERQVTDHVGLVVDLLPRSAACPIVASRDSAGSEGVEAR
jgi:endonuclease/exonuclease/phosphatase family metal-dependent hydrolase